MAGPDGVHLTRIQNQTGARISQRDFGEMTEFCIDVLVDELQPAKTMLLERYQIAITQWQLTRAVDADIGEHRGYGRRNAR